MAYTVRSVEYFHATVRNEPGEAYKLLTALADRGVNLVAFTAVPLGPTAAQVAIFPEDPVKLRAEASQAGLVLDGPHPALLVQGDDELGALARIHGKLSDAGVDVFASSGVANGRGSFGYVIYVRPQDHERAVEALGV